MHDCPVHPRRSTIRHSVSRKTTGSFPMFRDLSAQNGIKCRVLSVGLGSGALASEP